MPTTMTDLLSYWRTHRRALCRFEAVAVMCDVLDLRAQWGTVHALVSPVYGEGSQWVDVARLRVAEEAGTVRAGAR